MADLSAILDAIYAAVDEVNLLLPPDRHLAKAASTPIAGEEASLDSLGFLNLVMQAEAKINERVAEPMNLAEGLLENASGEPPQTLGELASLAAALQEA